MSRSSGGPAPEGNSSKPIHHCSSCGAMYSGGPHTCRQADRRADRQDDREAGA